MFPIKKPASHCVLQEKAWGDKHTSREWIFSIPASFEGIYALLQKGCASYE